MWLENKRKKMIKDSKYLKKFDSNEITLKKYTELYNLAVKLRDFRNKISVFISKNIIYFSDKNIYAVEAELEKIFNGQINSCFNVIQYKHVYKDYKNKLDAIRRKIIFYKNNDTEIEYYKINTKTNQKGDVKSKKTKREQTNLTRCLTYLTRYGHENILNFIERQKEQLEKENKIQELEFYNNIIYYCKKYTFNRLYKLALERRTNIINRYNKEPIKYTSLTFCGRSRKINFLEYNKRYGSKINTFINLSGINQDNFYIPIKYCKQYHGDMCLYLNKKRNFEYIVVFNEYKKQISILLCIKGKRYIPDAKDKTVGIDVNLKNNLFTTSNGLVYDFNRDLLKEYTKINKEIDKLKKNKLYHIGKKKQKKINTLKNKINKNEEKIISDICKQFKKEGIHHVVLENLSNKLKKCFILDKINNNFNYNRIIEFLGLSKIKTKFEHIARKYDIAVSLVHPYYTSKMCNRCGCIDNNNRKTQEYFKCIKCGYEANADYNAALNIKDRVVVTVLQKRLLKQMGNNTFLPKSFKKNEVKNILLLYHLDLLYDTI